MNHITYLLVAGREECQLLQKKQLETWITIEYLTYFVLWSPDFEIICQFSFFFFFFICKSFQTLGLCGILSLGSSDTLWLSITSPFIKRVAFQSPWMPLWWNVQENFETEIKFILFTLLSTVAS